MDVQYISAQALKGNPFRCDHIATSKLGFCGRKWGLEKHQEIVGPLVRLKVLVDI